MRTTTGTRPRIFGTAPILDEVTESTWASDEPPAPAPISSPMPPKHLIESDDEEAPIPGPGETTFGWRVNLFTLWMLAIAALSSVWQVSARIGHTTIWLGPAGEPNPLLVQFAPFFGPIIVLILIIANRPSLPVVGGLVSLALIGLGIVDLSYYRRLGVIEIVTGGLCLITTLAALVGRVPSSAD